MDFVINNLSNLIWGSVGISFLYGLFLIADVLRSPAGDEKMLEIATAIQQGAAAYLKRQYMVVAAVALALAAAIYFGLSSNTAMGFLIGAFLSALAGFIGMSVSVRANVRVAEAAKNGLVP